MEEKKVESDIDRISELPNPILENILSRIDMHDVVRTSLVSKRWRHIWKSVPNILLRRDLGRKYHGLIFEKFAKFVEGVLLQRDGSPIRTLHLFSPLPYDAMEDRGQIESWLSHALRQHVQQIHLQHVKLLQLSSIRLACQVKILKLTEVTLPQKGGELHLESPLLEELIVKACYFYQLSMFRISAPRLKLFMDEHDSLSEFHARFCNFQLDAPMLESLHLHMVMYSAYTLGDLSKLDTANIHIYFNDRTKLTNLENLLHGLVYVESLSLEVTQNCLLKSWSTSTFQWVSITYHNLRVLKLTRWCDNGYFGPIAKLLASFPCVEILILEDPKEIFMLEEEEHSSSTCRLNHLKSIEIQYPNRYVHEGLVHFFSLLMSKAVVLEKIVVKGAKWREREELLEFCAKLRSLPQVPSRVTVVFKISVFEELLIPIVHGVCK